MLLGPQHQPFHNTDLLLQYHTNRDHLLGILVLDGEDFTVAYLKPC